MTVSDGAFQQKMISGHGAPQAAAGRLQQIAATLIARRGQKRR